MRVPHRFMVLLIPLYEAKNELSMLESTEEKSRVFFGTPPDATRVRKSRYHVDK